MSDCKNKPGVTAPPPVQTDNKAKNETSPQSEQSDWSDGYDFGYGEALELTEQWIDGYKAGLQSAISLIEPMRDSVKRAIAINRKK